jgi:hypothetical protein
METNLALFALGFALGLAVGFGRPCRVIAERVHAGEEDIQKYEFKKWGRRGTTASAASFGGKGDGC